MRATVDQDLCISCGMCIDICPNVFSYNSDNKSIAIDTDIPSEYIAETQESRDACPVDAISIEDDNGGNNTTNGKNNKFFENSLDLDNDSDIETYSSDNDE